MAVIVWLLLACRGPDAGDTGPTQPVPVDARVEAFVQLASAEGWTTAQGDFSFLDTEICCVEGANCLLNNPTSPYGLYALPPGEGQTGQDQMYLDNGTARSFHLREDEALVLLGHMPPRARYFGLRTYISFRNHPQPANLFGSLGASLNQLVITERLGAEPWDQPIAVVTTADQVIEQQVHGWLRAAGFAAGEIHDDRQVHASANYGLDAQGDNFLGVARVAMFEDPERGAAFIEDPGMVLLRVTPPAPIVPTAPHQRPDLPERGTNTDEAAWADALDALGAAIQATYDASHDGIEIEATTYWYETLDCLDEGFCAGDIRDRHNDASPPFLLTDTQMFVVAFGVNHARTGKATYSNLAVSQLDGLMGVGAVDSDQMVGSARHYLPDHPQADDLFAWVVARDCSQRPEPHCLEVPYDCPGVPAGELMMLTFRAYLELATGAAPHEDEMLRARAVHYSPASTAP